MKQERDLDRWASMSPQAVAEGSQAQVMYCIKDAQHDIAALGLEVASLSEKITYLENALKLIGITTGGPDTAANREILSIIRDALHHGK